MKKFFLRFLLFIIFIPLLLLIILVLNFSNFVLLSVFITIFAIIGAFEVKNFFSSGNDKIKIGWIFPLFGGSFSILAYILLWLKDIPWLTELWIVAILLFVLIKIAFIDCRNNYEPFVPILSATFFTILYPGFFLSYLIRILEFNYPQFVCLLLIGSVFGNDIAAYLGGKFLGSKTKLNLKISPNKTLIGFLSGFIFTILYNLLFYYFIPSLFNTNIIIIICFAILISLTTILGDLIESAMKRSVKLKDSGTIMMGRGGILDSIDSLLISAPIFYFLYPLISGQ